MTLKHCTLTLLILLLTIPATLSAGEHANQYPHPIKTGHIYSKTDHCPNCGMSINMWARTRQHFTLGGTQYETCSLHCMADLVEKAGEPATSVLSAVYFKPEKMVDSLTGWYVIGSQAPGTMTMTSKIFFADKEQAEQFSSRHGGTTASFAQALAKAQKELKPMRLKIQAKRLKKGTIAQPDADVSCANCGMAPAAYPAFHSQIQLKGKKTLHFCSTKCLVKQKDTLANSSGSMWVTVYPDGDTEFAEGLYYVVGSDIMGPMGPDAMPFRKKQDALECIKEHGGTVLPFKELNSGLFGGMGQHHM